MENSSAMIVRPQRKQKGRFGMILQRSLVALVFVVLLVQIKPSSSPQPESDLPVRSLTDVSDAAQMAILAHQRLDNMRNRSESAATAFASSLARGEHSSIRVFIGIKTGSPNLKENKRLESISKTWLQDALREERVNIKFFTKQDKDVSNPDFSSATMIPVTKCKDKDLPCRTAAMFEYFLLHEKESHFFCNFDDDNYVLISNLMDVLTAYYNDKALRDTLYVGRQSKPFGVLLKGGKHKPVQLRFLTGGAGYCISRNLVKRGLVHFVNLSSLNLPDDMAVGYVMQEHLQVKLLENKQFHSHLETSLKFGPLYTREAISQQVSFGYNDKQIRHLAAQSIPAKISIKFSPEEDPLLFQSIWCFLHDYSESNATSTFASYEQRCLSSTNPLV